MNNFDSVTNQYLNSINVAMQQADRVQQMLGEGVASYEINGVIEQLEGINFSSQVMLRQLQDLSHLLSGAVPASHKELLRTMAEANHKLAVRVAEIKQYARDHDGDHTFYRNMNTQTRH